MENNKQKRVLVTGAAGFIGHHLSKLLVKNGFEVIGLDNINDYYDVELKYARLADMNIDRDQIEYNKIVSGLIDFIKLDLTDRENILELFKNSKINYVVNLAAQAGVRYSLINPHSYVDSNITGFLITSNVIGSKNSSSILFNFSSSFDFFSNNNDKLCFIIIFISKE